LLLHDVADLQQQQYEVWRVIGILIVRHFCSSGFQKRPSSCGIEQVATLKLHLGRSPTVETKFVNTPPPIGSLERDS
jgi:hypothetical protein